jgi:ligand-binding sensor domain-containing protein
MHPGMAAARRLRSFAWCASAALGLVAGLQHTALAQDAQRPVCVAAAVADTGYVHTIGDRLGGRVLIGAADGLFLAHEVDGKITVSRAGDADTGRVPATQSFARGALIGAWNGVYLAREAAGQVTIERVGGPDTGPVHLMPWPRPSC